MEVVEVEFWLHDWDWESERCKIHGGWRFCRMMKENKCRIMMKKKWCRDEWELMQNHDEEEVMQRGTYRLPSLLEIRLKFTLTFLSNS